MKFEDLKKLDPKEIRTAVVELSKDESFVEQVVNSEELLNLLLKAKTLPKIIEERLSKTKEGAIRLIDACHANGFTPSLEFIESLVSYNDEILVDAIQKFPTIPFGVGLFTASVNMGLMGAAELLYKTKPEVRRVETLTALLKSGTEDQAIVEDILKHDGLSTTLAKLVTSDDVGGFSKAALSLSIKDYLSRSKDTHGRGSSRLLGYNIGTENIKSLIMVDDYYMNTTEWSEDLESAVVQMLAEGTPGFDRIRAHNLPIKNPPRGSIFRDRFIRSNPEEAGDDELINLIKEIKNVDRYISEKVALQVILRGLVEKVDAAKLFSFITPSYLADKVRNMPVEKRVELLSRLPTRHKAAVRKTVPVEKLPTETDSRKSSFFDEAIRSVMNDDLGSFRKYTSGKYTLEKFASDTMQSSKEKMSRNTELSQSFAAGLEAAEFVALATSRIRLKHDFDVTKLNIKLNTEEMTRLIQHRQGHMIYRLNVSDLFMLASDKAACLNMECLSAGDLLAIYTDCDLSSDPKLLDIYASRISNKQSLAQSVDNIVLLASRLKAKELRALLSETLDCDITKLIPLKCKDGKFLLSEDEILQKYNGRFVHIDKTCILALYERDKALCDEVKNAITGKPSQRMKICLSERVSEPYANSWVDTVIEEASETPEHKVDRVFGESGKCFLKTLVNEFGSDTVKYLNAHGKGRTVTIERDEISYYVDTMKEINGVKFKANSVIVYNLELFNKDDLINRVTFAKIYMYQVPKDYAHLVEVFKKVIVRDNPEIEFAHNYSHYRLRALLLATIAGVHRAYEDAVEILNGDLSGLSRHELSCEDLEVLVSRGFKLDRHFVAELLGECNLDSPLIPMLSKHLGDLSSYVVRKKWSRYGNVLDKMASLTQSTGLVFLDNDAFELESQKRRIQSEGVNFGDVNVEGMTKAEKMSVIKVIESIDPEYAKINLKSVDLDSIKTLYSYHKMASIYSVDDESLIRALSIPKNISSSKKIMKGIRDAMSLSGGAIADKLVAYKQFVEQFSPSSVVEFTDLVDTGDLNNIKVSSEIDPIKPVIMRSMVDHAMGEFKAGNLLRGASLKDMRAFMRSASDHGDARYIKDIVSLIGNVTKGTAGIQISVDNLSKFGPDTEQAQRVVLLKGLIKTITERMEQVSTNNNAEYVHNTLVGISSMVSEDSIEPLKQEKFSKLEKDKESASRLGFKIYFPKTRGELMLHGHTTHGWCVGEARRYADEVISDGNILVGVLEDGAEPSFENLTILMHFRRKKDGSYYHTESKWSKRVQGGRNNVDATDESNHKKIIEEIENYLSDQKSVEFKQSKKTGKRKNT
jgi:hypothetical protein